MYRKDCDMKSGVTGRYATRIARTDAALCALLACALAAPTAWGGELRVWSSAVVVADSIRLGDVAELRGMESFEETDPLRNIVLTDAPPAGGSRIIHHELIRLALSAKGVNLAKVCLVGAAQCEVRRPAVPQQRAGNQANEAATSLNHHQDATGSVAASKPETTLRKEIEDYFHREFAHYGGRAEVLFDRSDDHILDLTAPPLEFRIAREKSQLLGLCALQVEVAQSGKPVQKIPLVVRTTMNRSVLMARRAINQGATVIAADVDLMPVSFTKLDELRLDDPAAVIGQRAKKFIAAGSRIESEMFEPVPLVLRGQLITLVAEVGGVRVVTTAKACANGMRGEMIRVRSVDDAKVEFDAVVTGPGEAKAAGGTERSGEDSNPRLASGVKS